MNTFHSAGVLVFAEGIYDGGVVLDGAKFLQVRSRRSLDRKFCKAPILDDIRTTSVRKVDSKSSARVSDQDGQGYLLLCAMQI